MFCTARQHRHAADWELGNSKPLSFEDVLFTVVLFRPVYTPVELFL